MNNTVKSNPIIGTETFVEFFIFYCESATIPFCKRSFFYFLIKRVDVFTKSGWCSLPRGWGAPIYNWKKLKIEKTKEGLCTIQKVKTKTLQMKVFQFHT